MKTIQRSGIALCLAFALTSLGCAAQSASLTSSPFGRTRDGRPVTRYTMTAASGVSVTFMNYGGIVTDVTAPDRRGRRAPIVLGFSTLREYETTGEDDGLYFGAIIGRYANYIAGGRFRLDGRTYTLAKNYPPTPCTAATRGSTSGCGTSSRMQLRAGASARC